MKTTRKQLFRTLGGQGSGNFGHAGRPGEVGGSGEGGDTSIKAEPHKAEEPVDRVLYAWAQKYGVSGSKELALVKRQLLKGKSLKESVAHVSKTIEQQKRSMLGDELYEKMVKEGKIRLLRA